jgi:DNA polymerase-4|nr:hypothetical protein [uncultured Lamprocystis sp.]
MSTGPARWIMHLDLDACYAAVEQRDHPALRGLPVVVGAQPGGRGVVATCSYEARRFGIHSAMPIHEAHRRCPDAVYLRPRMAHYLEVARQIRMLYRHQKHAERIAQSIRPDCSSPDAVRPGWPDYARSR